VRLPVRRTGLRRTGGNKDTAYTAGLLHDVGRLALLASYPAEYARMLDVSDEFGYDLLGCEQDLFDIDHCVAGEWLVREWHFRKSASRYQAPPPEVGRRPAGPAGVWHFSCRMPTPSFSVITSSSEDLSKLKEELPPKLLAILKDEEAFTALITERVKALESTL